MTNNIYEMAYEAWTNYCEETGEPGIHDNEEAMHSFCDDYVEKHSPHHVGPQPTNWYHSDGGYYNCGEHWEEQD